jgi:hypothetical protein
MQSIMASALDLITAIRHGIAAELLSRALIILSWFQELLPLPQNRRLDRFCGVMSINSMAVNIQCCHEEEVIKIVSLFSILRPAISAGCIRNRQLQVYLLIQNSDP